MSLKHINMVGKRKLCEVCGIVRPSYVAPGIKKSPTHCAKCRPPHFVHKYAKRCKYEGCHKYVVRKGRCVEHGASIPKCINPKCTKNARNGNLSYCTAHGGKRKLCIIKSCTRLAQSKNFCATHGFKRPKCTISDCKNRCLSKQQGLCITHGGGRRCDETACNDYATHKNRDKRYCLLCYCLKYNIIPKYRKLRELKLHGKIQQHFPNIKFRWNMALPNTRNSRRRPDWSIDLKHLLLIIENDENQHRYRKCEEKRMCELFRSADFKSIVFLRFNPDQYVNENGERVRGCFKSDHTTQYSLICNNSEFERRWDALARKIYYYLNLENTPAKEMTIEYMFYDGYKG